MNLLCVTMVGISWAILIVAAEKGERGERGMPGYPGYGGRRGEDGNPGRTGESGDPGIPGDLGLDQVLHGDMMSEIKAVVLKLNQVLDDPATPGIRNSRGAIGLKGRNGPQGYPGRKGNAGHHGNRGFPGPRGQTGMDCLADGSQYHELTKLLDKLKEDLSNAEDELADT